MNQTKLMMDGYEHFVKNKYYYWYIDLINKKISNPPPINSYKEKHHILPRSLGGNNKRVNIVELTFREHIIAHKLLTKFTTNEDYYKMMYAFKCLFDFKNNKRIASVVQYYDYLNKAREMVRNASSERLKAKWEDIEWRSKFCKDQSVRVSNQWKNGQRDKNELISRSPFKNMDTIRKTQQTRRMNGINPFITKNPMLDQHSKNKKIEKTSGNNHYLRKNRKYFYKHKNDIEWIEIDNSNGLKVALDKLGFNYVSFFNILNGKKIKRKDSPLFNILIKRVIIDEN